MTPEQWMAQQIRERGIKQSFLANKIGVRESKLSFCLTGRSKMQVPVFLALCYELRLDPMEYLEVAHEGA